VASSARLNLSRLNLFFITVTLLIDVVFLNSLIILYIFVFSVSLVILPIVVLGISLVILFPTSPTCQQVFFPKHKSDFNYSQSLRKYEKSTTKCALCPTLAELSSGTVDGHLQSEQRSSMNSGNFETKSGGNSFRVGHWPLPCTMGASRSAPSCYSNGAFLFRQQCFFSSFQESLV
jgi:hypothetical protein